MKNIIYDAQYGKVEFNEGFWTGKKELIIDGIKLTKVSKNQYSYVNGDIDTVVLIKGNYISGSELLIGDYKIQLTEKTKWWEFVIAFLPVIFIMIWGNSTALCSIFPLVGGAMGGFISGIVSVFGLLFIKGTKSKLMKVLIAIGAFVVTVLFCYLVAVVLISMMQAIQ